MDNEIIWLEDWCSANIKSATAADLGRAHTLALRATKDAEEKGIDLRSAVVALGYPILDDYMLDQLGAKADAGAQRRALSGYGRGTGHADPEARYVFSPDRKGRALEPKWR